MSDFVLWYIMLNISNNLKIKILSEYGNEEKIYNEFEKILNKYPTLNKRMINYNKVEEIQKVHFLKEFIKSEKVGYITIGDEAYPNRLREIEEPPYVLFYKGNINLLRERKIVSIIGSRNCTSYGIRVTSLISKQLSSCGVVIASGGARGIDSVAHRECLESEGKTIVVLGCGIDVTYPLENKRLFEKVIEDGLIITEFNPGTKPMNYNFPRRNRIISGISEILVVTEATEKSGSLITANLALNQGKNVFTVPGSIFSKESRGCNLIFSEGANVFTDMIDLYLALGITNELKNRKNEKDNNILNIIGDEPIHIDEIIKRTDIDRGALYGLLFDLQNKKQIISLPGNYYAKIS